MAYQVQFAGDLMVLTFSDELSGADCRALAETIVALEKKLERSPDRLIDLSTITRFGVGYAEFESMVRTRRASPPKNAICTAILAPSDLQFGIGRMFENLNQHPLVKTSVFRERAEALAWLEESARN